MQPQPRITSIDPVLPVRDVSAAVAFYVRLGFALVADYLPTYAILERDGAWLHLRYARDEMQGSASEGAVYIYADEVEGFYELCLRESAHLLHAPCRQPWGTLEFALSDPDGNLIRIGRIVR